jgi:uncharacterized protein HemX
MLPNPWIIVGVLVAVLGAGGSGYMKGRLDQKNAAVAKTEKQRTLQETIERGIAEGVAQIKVENTTIRQKLETVVRENHHYIDCKLDPTAFGLLNDVLTGTKSVRPGDRVMPEADAAP